MTVCALVSCSGLFSRFSWSSSNCFAIGFIHHDFDDAYSNAFFFRFTSPSVEISKWQVELAILETISSSSSPAFTEIDHAFIGQHFYFAAAVLLVVVLFVPVPL